MLVSPENMTCGIKSPSDYCIQTHGIYRECDRCDATSEEKAHKPEYLTDIHTESNPTWWQSTTMLENVHTQELKLTANLGAFIILLSLLSNMELYNIVLL